MLPPPVSISLFLGNIERIPKRAAKKRHRRDRFGNCHAHIGFFGDPLNIRRLGRPETPASHPPKSKKMGKSRNLNRGA